MAKNTFPTAAAFLALVIAASTACAAQPADDSEAALRARVQQAVWPADIVALSSSYLARFPNGTWSRRLQPPARARFRRDARARQQGRAALPQCLRVRQRVRCGQPRRPPGRAGRPRRRAAPGAPAARRRDGTPLDPNRYVGWLQYATRLGNRDASYELAVHYRRQDQPVLASQYEARAIEMGYVPPRWLDHIRK